MASDVDFIRERLKGERVLAVAQGISMAVALTDSALVTGTRGLFGRWGQKLQRYALDRLTGVQVIPNPSANFLRAQFEDSADGVAVLLPTRAQAEFDTIVAALQERMARRGGGAHA